jgi:diaminohydroxyphosphoribosylaminopyrimidine deaminase/5-amino-6-(5-phosphoribosylamino)uracil reductase
VRHENSINVSFHEEKRPYVILKWAQTLDGYFDKVPNQRREGVNWITSSITKPLVHQWRSEEQAIMVGWKTITNDNPALTVREVAGISPERFIIDPHCQTPIDAKVIHDGHSTTLLVKTNSYSKLPEHIKVIAINNFSSQGILDYLYSKDLISVFIEGGAHTLQKFIDSNLWDEARILTGDVTFEEGLKAPNIDHGRITSTDKLGTNTVTYIERS